jgi:hypothetical protein
MAFTKSIRLDHGKCAIAHDDDCFWGAKVGISGRLPQEYAKNPGFKRRRTVQTSLSGKSNRNRQSRDYPYLRNPL